MRLYDRLFISPVSWFLFVWWEFCMYFSFKTTTSKNHVQKIYWLLAESFVNPVQDRCFSRFRDGRRNLFVNTSKRSCLFCFPNNVAKTWSLRWKFQGTLKSSISFSWKSVFICLIHSMEVMSQIQKVRYVLNIFVPFT